MAESSVNKTIIHLKRSFPCSIRPLFDAFLDAEIFRQWFSPPGYEVGTVSINPVEGGNYSCQLLKENKPALLIRGKYIYIKDNSSISFSFLYEPDVSSMGETKVTVTFKEYGGNTEITLIQEIYKDIPTEGRTKGWEYILDKLEKLLNKK